MRAIRVHRLGDPEVLRLEEVADLEPGPGQLRVRLHAAGVNPVDAYVRAGAHGYGGATPYTPGRDGAGVVDAVGEGVAGVAVGDRVYTAGSLTGCYAEQTLCTPDQVHPLPERVGFAAGAAVGVPYAAAYRALFQRARARPGETVLVHGASGGVGLAALQLARAAGLQVLGTAGDEAGWRLVREQGAHAVLDHGNPDHFAQVLAHTGGRGVDVVLEMLANVNLGRDLGVLAQGGRVVVIGSRGPVEIDPREALSREAAILGMALLKATQGELATIHAALGAGLESGVLRPVVGRELPLERAAEAHREILTWGGYGKIVLLP